MPLFQSRHPVEQLHEFSFLCPHQFTVDTIGHIETTTVDVFIGNNQVKGLHHQFLVFLQGLGEVLIGFHAHQGHNGFPFPDRQRMIQPHRFCGKPGMDYQNVVRFAVAGGNPTVERSQMFLQVCQSVQLCQLLHGSQGIDKRQFLQDYHGDALRFCVPNLTVISNL